MKTKKIKIFVSCPECLKEREETDILFGETMLNAEFGIDPNVIRWIRPSKLKTDGLSFSEIIKKRIELLKICDYIMVNNCGLPSRHLCYPDTRVETKEAEKLKIPRIYLFPPNQEDMDFDKTMKNEILDIAK